MITTIKTFLLENSLDKPYLNIGIDMDILQLQNFVKNTKINNEDFDTAYNNLINRLNCYIKLPNSIILYRLLFLEDNNINSINYEKIGNHFVLNKSDINNDMKDSIKPSAYGIDNWYLLTVEIPKSKINFKRTMMQNLLFPLENEIYATNIIKDEIIKIEKY